MEELELELKRYALTRPVSAEFAQSVKVSHSYDVLVDSMLIQVEARVLAHNLPPEHFTAERSFVHNEPASPWQMWKMRHAPAWFIERWPVQLTPFEHQVKVEFDLSRFRAYPDAPRLPPRYGNPVPQHIISPVVWEEQL